MDVEGERLAAETVIVNTGARPRVPPVPGLDRVPWLDNEAALFLTELPRHLLVMGGGYIGCELGQAFRRLGAEVTIIQSGPHLMDREDEDVSQALEEAFQGEGIALRLERRAEEVRREGEEIVVKLSDGSEVAGSHLLVAVGRVPNTDDLGCDAAGIRRDDSGFIQVDDRYRTSVEGVYAVGDCTGGAQFTHSSWDDHRILFDLLHGEDRRTRADRLVPHGAFTDPQVARVGLSEREADERDVSYEVATLPFRHIARAYETGRTPGLVKILLDPGTERILGATVVGAEGNELIGVFQMLMMADAPATALVDAEMIHPSFGEGLQSALMSLDRYGLS